LFDSRQYGGAEMDASAGKMSKHDVQQRRKRDRQRLQAVMYSSTVGTQRNAVSANIFVSKRRIINYSFQRKNAGAAAFRRIYATDVRCMHFPTAIANSLLFE